MGSSLCSVGGCCRPSGTRGWCSKHYQRWLAKGDVLAPMQPQATRGEPARYLRDVAIPFSGDECLLWPFGATNGRGRIQVGDRSHLAYRLVCAAVHGEPPAPGHECAHSCGNGHLGCVNPHHLRWATRSENAYDMVLHGTSCRGERNGRAKLTAADVHEIRAKISAGQTLAAIAADHGVSRKAIRLISAGKNWGWL